MFLQLIIKYVNYTFWEPFIIVDFFTDTIKDEDLEELMGTFEFVRSQRGKPILLYDNFRFRKERSLNNVIRWRCVGKNCKGKSLTKK